MAAQGKQKRRWLRFSLGTMFVVLTVGCVWLGWLANRERRRARLNGKAVRAFLVSIFMAITIVCTTRVGVGGELEDEGSSLYNRLNPRLFQDSGERDNIIERIREIGPEARVTTPLLLKILERKGNALHVELALESIGGEAVPQMLALIEHENPSLRRTICELLEKIGTDAEAAIPALVKRVKEDSDATVQSAALLALSRIGARSELAVAALHDAIRNEATASNAATALLMGDIEDGVSVEVLLQATKYKSPDTRIAALECLARYDEEGRRVAIALAEAIVDQEVIPDGVWGFSVGDEASVQLEWLGESAAPAVPIITELIKSDKLNESHLPVFRRAVRVLSLDPKSATDAVSALQRMMRRELDADGEPDWVNAEVRVDAALTLCLIQHDDMAAYDELVQILTDRRWRRDPDEGLWGPSFLDPRPEAAAALGQLEARAKSAVPQLRELLKEGLDREHDQLAAEAAWALARIDPSDPSCRPGIGKKIPYLWLEPLPPDKIAMILRAHTKEVTPELIDKLFFWSARTRIEHRPRSVYLEVLLHLDPDPVPQIVERAIESLHNVDADTANDLRTAALNVLDALGPRAAPAVPKLVESLNDKHPLIRANAAQALGLIGENADVALPALVRALEDSRAIVRAEAAKAIGRFDVAATAQLDELRSALDDDYLIVSQSARNAIDAIERAH